MAVIDAVFGFISRVPDWLWGVILIGFPLTLLVAYLRWWVGRRGRWEAAARRMGFRMLSDNVSAASLFRDLDVFAGGRHTAFVYWGCTGLTNGMAAWIMDQGTRQRSKQAPRGRTVCVVRNERARWPHVVVQERSRSGAGGGGEFGLPADPRCERFRASSGDAAAAREWATAEVCAAIARLADQVAALEREADSPAVRLMLRGFYAATPITVEVHRDAVVVAARRFLDPAVAEKLLAAAADAAVALAWSQGSQRPAQPLDRRADQPPAI